MKTILYNIIFIFIINTTAFAQDSITVTITGDCTTLTGIYDFTGLINGKNNYYAEFTIDGELIDLQIGFDGTKWVFYTDNDLDDFGFFNLNVPNGLLPPNTGWQVEYCINGTLIIDGGVASTNDSTLSNTYKIYQTSSNFLEISSESILDNGLDINLYTFNGRKIISKKVNNNNLRLNVSSLTKGLYLVRVNGFVKKVLIY